MFSGKPFEVNLNSLATILVFSQSIAGNRLDIFLKSTIQEKDIIYHISNPLHCMKRIFSYLLSVHLSALLVFTLFRGTLYFLQSDLVPASDQAYRLNAFLMGLRFDNVICCYILTVPLLLLIASDYLPRWNRGIYRAVHLWFCLFYSLAFLISAADIPYFIQFFNHLNASIWNWLDEPSFVFTMMAQEKSFLIYGILFIGIDIAFCYQLLFLKNKILIHPPIFTKQRLWIPILTALPAIAFCILGIRGRIEGKSPIRIGTAYFCGNPFLNQLGLNPSFVLIRSTLDQYKKDGLLIKMMPPEEATDYMAASLHATGTFGNNCPIAREIRPDTTMKRRNVVLILMESMSNFYMEQKELTPFLNELTSQATYYPNCFSAGIHTMNGMAGTLFSEPALMNQHPFKHYEIQEQQSLFGELKKQGYQTYYFTTHDEQFDNINGYLTANHTDRIYSEKDYPAQEIHSNLGCTDDYLFQNAIRVLRRSYRKNQPFLSVFLTASNHQPYIIPKDYHPRQKDKQLQVVEYSDYALRHFFETAAKEPWYPHTIFVLLGDHGRALTQEIYDVSLDYHHTPLIFFDPLLPQAEKRSDPVAQIDVFPTIMGLLQIPWINCTLGVDVRKEKRKYVVFSSDNAYCCIDSLHYFVNRSTGIRSLYEWPKKNGQDIIEKNAGKADEMDKYARAFLQTGQYLKEQGSTQ